MKVAVLRTYMSFRSEQMVQREQNDDALTEGRKPRATIICFAISVLRSYPFC